MKRALFLAIVFILATVWPAAAARQASPWTSPEAILAALPDVRCEQKPERGPCKALFERFHYHAKDRKCLPFFWGGCEGTVPFETLEECKKVCEPPETLRIKELRSLNDDLYAVVYLEYPKGWEAGDFQVLVAGKEVNARRRSGGYSDDRRMESLLFFPGKPGVKRVSVKAAVEGREAETSGSLEWKPRPFAVLLDYLGDGMLVTARVKLRVVTANTGEVTLLFNGKAMKPEVLGRDATLLSFDPPWRPGLNSLSVEGKGVDGTTVSRSYSFVYSEGEIRLGEAALMSLNVGREGSKSGPFYSVTIEGDAIATVKDLTVDAYVMDDGGWVGSEARLVRELKAVKPGRASVKIFEKPHFLQTKSLKEEYFITVLPAEK
jgi:hypothetical protein